MRLRSIAVLLGILCSAPSLVAAPDERVGVLLAPFSHFRGEPDAGIEALIGRELTRRLQLDGFRVLADDRPIGNGLEENLATARGQRASVLIGGFYFRRANGTLDVYAQVFHPETGLVIDAYSVTEIASESLGIKLPPEERRTPREAVARLADKLVVGLRANPNRREREEHIRDHVTGTPVSQAMRFPVRVVDAGKRAEEVFRLFGEVEVVTASRRRQRISEAPSNIVALTGEMIRRRGYLTLTEALQDVPFFDFTAFHDGGEYPTHFLLRGLTDVGQTKVLTMEDGIVQNDINFGWSRNLSYNTTFSDVQRIEIILGPGSALYGANAYAGLVNVITKDADSLYAAADQKNGFLFDGGLLYGRDRRAAMSGPLGDTLLAPLTRQEKDAHAYGGDGLAAYRFDSGLTLQLAARWYHAEGDGGHGRPDPGNYFHGNFEPDAVFTTEYGTVENDRVLGRTKRIRDGFDTEKKSLFLRGRISYRRFVLGFNYWDRHDGLGSYVPGHEYFTNDPEKNYDVHHKGYGVTASHELPLSRRSSLRTRAYYRASLVLPQTGFIYTYRFQDVERPVMNGVVLPPVVDKCKCYSAQGQIFGVEEQYNFQPNASNELVVGLQLERLQRQFLGISLGPPPSGESNVVAFTFSDTGPFEQTTKTEVFYTTNGAVFVQDEQKFLRDYAVTGGVRYDVLSDVDGTDRLRARGRLVAAGVLNVRAGLVGNPTIDGLGRVNFKLLYGEAFKSPTLFELFDEFRGNPNLKPQQIKTYEAIGAFTPLKMITVQASYFFSLLQDVIEIRPNDGTVPIGTQSQKETFSQNVEATHMYGGVLGIVLRLGRRLHVSADYSVTADRDRSTPLSVRTNSSGGITDITLVEDGHEVDNIAMRKGNLAVNYLLAQKYNFNLRANRVGRRKAPVTNRYFQPYDYEFARRNYDYEVEGTPDGYMSGYTIWHFTFTWKDALGYEGLEPQLIVRNLFNTAYAGIGRQAGSSVRPISAVQPQVGNPPGFIPPYHPQPGREILFRVNYRY